MKKLKNKKLVALLLITVLCLSSSLSAYAETKGIYLGATRVYCVGTGKPTSVSAACYASATSGNINSVSLTIIATCRVSTSTGTYDQYIFRNYTITGSADSYKSITVPISDFESSFIGTLIEVVNYQIIFNSISTANAGSLNGSMDVGPN